MLPLWFALVPPLLGSPSAGELPAVAATSPRPAACVTSAARRRDWRSARTPRLASFCAALAAGYGRLRFSPGDALAAAERAREALPGRAEPEVLAARALLAEGDDAAAFERFGQALALSARSLDSPLALHDYALSALRSGHVEQARSALVMLVPRASLIADAAVQRAIYVEAACVALSGAEASLDAALATLGEARRIHSHPGDDTLLLALTALVLELSGDRDGARATARLAGGESVLEGERGERALSLLSAVPGGLAPAVLAVLAEADDPAASVAHWKAFLGGPGASGPWAEHARKRIAGR